MRNNQPVTDVEIGLDDETMIVSKTDLKGRITYVNQDFLEISGFAESELIGEPHNIVRHPDMPAAAFEDLWSTVRSGAPWRGIVKNRCKNGDFYWVEATITPLSEKGSVVGYMSVRRKASRASIEAAEALYREVAAGRATLGHRPGFWDRLSLRNKLLFVASVLTAFVVGLASLFAGMRAQSLLEERSVRLVTEQVNGARLMVENTDAQLQAEALRLNRIFASGFSGPFSVESGKSGSIPLLRHGSKVLNGKHSEVDRLGASNGLFAALYVRAGEDFLPVASSLKNADGQRVSGAVLNRGQAAQAKLLAGEGYASKEVGAGRDVYVSYLPIRNAAGQVVGATSVSVDVTEPLKALRQSLKAIHIGDSGYVYVLDAHEGPDYGRLVVHPAKEGENILKASDAHGREFIRELLSAKGGTLHYAWRNEELGESRAREKIVVGRYFPDWQWVIAGGTYVEETGQDIRAFITMVVVSGVLALALVGVVLVVLLKRIVSSPLAEVNEALGEIAQGNLTVRTPIALDRPDEIGQLVRALTMMQTRMGFELAETRRIADETLRLKIGLDNVATNVMLANAHFEIIYMNRSLQRMFETTEDAIKQSLPHFDRHRLIGANIDIFHKNPGHQRRMLAALDGTHHAEVKLGGHVFALAVTPVVDTHGHRLGYAVEWCDRTGEVRIEKEIAAVVAAAEQGNLEARLDTSEMTGFFAKLGNGINGLLQSNGRVLADLGEIFRRMANGDLTRKVESRYVGTLAEAVENANRTIDAMRDMVGAIKEATDTINTAAKEIASGNQDLSSRTEEQAGSLEETASSMEELTGTVRQNAESARQANELAGAAQAVAEKAGGVVDEVVETMSTIRQSSNRIADIIGVIDGIAFQTNILALNAAVEAARAGEQGRGFAVVATEVRSLAQRSAAAAKEIKGLISDSVDKVAAGNRLVEEAGRTMDEVVASIQRVAKIMATISDATREQSAGIDQVCVALSQMDQVTQQNASLVEQAAAAAESLEEQALMLADAVAVFRVSADAPRRAQIPPPAPKQGEPLPLVPSGRRVARKPVLPAALDDEWEEF